MIGYPREQRFIPHFIFSYCHSEVNKLIIIGLNMNAVDFEKCEHEVNAYSFVAVDKRMVGDQSHT